MIVIFDQSFNKSLDRLSDKHIQERLKALILSMGQAENLSELTAIKPMKGHPKYYRIRLGDYRVGFELTNKNEILLILVVHRKDIYKRFP